MSCTVCQSKFCWHCRTCNVKSTSLFGGECDSCYAKGLPGHFNCKECGKAYHSSMTGMELREGLCFNCNFWIEKVEWSTDPEEMPIRIDGVHYRPEIATHRGGFGGTKFILQTKDGAIFGTRNLWCQGDIPERFQDRLPDNAIFIDEDLIAYKM